MISKSSTIAVCALALLGMTVCAFATKSVPSALQELKAYGYELSPGSKAFHSEDITIRRLAMGGALEQPSAALEADMHRGLGDADAWVRVYAAAAFRRLGDERGSDVLREALLGSDADLAIEAAVQLGPASDLEVLEAVMEIVRTRGKAGRIRGIRVAGEAMRTSADAEGLVLPMLVSIAGDETEEMTVRRVATDELDTLRGNDQVRALMGQLAEAPDPVIRGLAQRFLR